MATTTTYKPSLNSSYDSDFKTAPYSRSAVKITAETKAAHVAAWVLQTFLGVAFLYFGAMKLGANAQMVQEFEAIGFGQWLRYVTGTVECVSAILLFTPRTAAVGAFFLACTMIGALLTHAFIIGGNPIPAAVLLVLSVALVALRWNRARAMIRQENVVNV